MIASDENRDRYLRKTYGITLKEYNSILKFQGGHCAGCPSVGITRSLHVDHSHVSKVVRGLLCASCNSALRKLKDNPTIAYNLGAYLEKPPAVTVLGHEVKAEVKPRRRRRRKVVKKP